jgi:Skp family chaperone for outer membrane proteins
VRKLLLSAAIIGLISSTAGLAQAQQAAPGGAAGGPAHGANAARYGIAVVDISFIFKNYPGFTSQIEALKGEMEAADGKLKADRDRLVQMEEQRNTLKPGSPEFKQLDEQLAHLKAEFTIKQGTIRRDFLEREAKVYYQTYTDVSNAVRSFASQHNIGMVLRFNGDAIDPAQREDVMRAIMQPIVHQNNIDITPDVLAVLGVDIRTIGAAKPAVPTATRPTQPAR